MRAGAKEDVGADAVYCFVHAGGGISEEAPHIARPERTKARLGHESSDAVDVLSHVGAELQAGVANPLAGEGRLDRALALAVGDVEEHRAAVVEEIERSPGRP